MVFTYDVTESYYKRISFYKHSQIMINYAVKVQDKLSTSFSSIQSQSKSTPNPTNRIRTR